MIQLRQPNRSSVRPVVPADRPWVEAFLEATGCRTLWVVTTNDNVAALRFYQRRGFRIRTIRPGAVDDARLHLKPTIPEVGDHGILLRDEIELELDIARY